MNNFANKVRKGQKTILYELLPPPRKLPLEDLEISFDFFAKTLKKYSVDAVNIPEIIIEDTRRNRDDSILEKLEPINVVRYLYKNNISNVIINRPIVHLPWENQRLWLKKTYTDGVRNFIFVGGESSSINYPGLAVIDAAKTAKTELKKELQNICLGGITIPSRKNEADRLVRKQLAGIDFFTTQVIYEPETIKKLIQDYWKTCRANKIAPKTIFLSFAPVATKRDIDFLTWLGVKIPKKTENYLKLGWFGIAERSFDTCEQILNEILLFSNKHSIQVPLGLNIEHINRHNFELSFLLLERLKNIYIN